jgi:hypothetical protein
MGMSDLGPSEFEQRGFDPEAQARPRTAEEAPMRR